MTVLGVVTVNLDRNGLGLRSLADQPFGQTTVLGQTLRRLDRCRLVQQWVLSTPADQVDAVRKLVGPDRTIERDETGEPSWREAIRRGRKWSLAGWRGGLARSSVFDEEGAPAELARLAKKYKAEWIVQARAEAPLVDPQLVDGIVQRAKQSESKPPLMYGSIAPGLAGWVYRPDFVDELARENLHPGYVLGYRAWDTTIELTEQLFSFKPAVEISRLPCRLIADNRHSLALLRRFESEADELDALTLAKRIEDNPFWQIPSAPNELEIEVTTRRSIAADVYPSVERRDMTVDEWTRVVDKYSAASDVSLVTLGGHGDPLEHAQWHELLARAGDAGVYGLALVTDGVRLDESAIDRLLDSPLDVLLVRLGGNTPASYKLVHGEDRFSEVSANLERFLQARKKRGQVHPLLAVELVRRRETLGEMEAFYDTWTSKAECAVIAPHRDFAGQLSADSVLSTEPPKRTNCRRLLGRMMILSDGRVVSCSEDFAAWLERVRRKSRSVGGGFGAG